MERMQHATPTCQLLATLVSSVKKRARTRLARLVLVTLWSVVLALIVILWARSYSVGDTLSWRGTRHEYEVFTGYGSLGLARVTAAPQIRSLRGGHSHGGLCFEVGAPAINIVLPPHTIWNRIGFKHLEWDSDLTPPAHITNDFVPFWLFAVVALVGLVAQIRGVVWNAGRKEGRECDRCGYDIRVHSGRCPECGNEIRKGN